MYNLNGLIPGRFLSLIAHFAVCVALLWENQPNCFPSDLAPEVFSSFRKQLVIGLSVTIGLIVFELIAFLSGATMFHSTSNLLSFFSHILSTIALTYFFLDSLECWWFWWIFSCSLLPAVFDSFVIIFICIYQKW